MRRRTIYGVATATLLLALVLAAFGVGEQAGKLSDWQAFTLGIVQGLTELLPISSSGHLILVPWLFDWHYLENHEDFNKTFDVALHLGTLVAVIVYFWQEVVLYVGAWFRSVGKRAIRTADERIAWLIFVATIPAAIAGAAGEETIEKHLGAPWQIAINLAVFGIVLWVADRSAETRKLEEIGLWTALGVGAAQAIALMPGVSRSGITITAGRFLKLDRDSAARLSFFLLIPIVFGAVVYKGLKHVVFGTLPPGSTGPFIVGTIAAAGMGLIAIDALLGYVRRHDYSIFVLYRLAAAAAILLLIATGVKDATF
ncbi:MAG: undecaprenyl-diphosphatase UppP [Actinobacteria bacterium]|nr:MAG: undecaprenyl-diphosphatase UppP [Actinomycetota bacterium]